MTTVTFFKAVFAENWQPYKTPLGSYTYPDHISKEDALEEAIKSF
jgi:hypothetical protein